MLKKTILHQKWLVEAIPVSKALISLVFIYLLIWFGAILYLTTTPYSGLLIKPNISQNSWIVTGLTLARKPLTITAIKTNNIEFEVEAADLTADPEVFATYDQFNRFMNRQESLSKLRHQSSWSLISNNHEEYRIDFKTRRPLGTLGIGFWVNTIAGFICLTVGLSIWLIKRGNIEAVLVLSGGLALSITGITAAIYSSRDIAISQIDFRILHAVNRVSVLTFAASMAALLWIYPIRLGSPKLIPAIFIWQWLLWLNETIQIIQWPIHTYYPIQLQLPLFFTFALIIVQWLHSKNRPLERAQLLWFFMSILLTSGSAVFLYATPVVMGLEPFVPLWLGNVFILMIYIGFVLGIMQFRLFDVQRWWIKTWFWFGVIIAVLLIDFGLIYLLNFNSNTALAFSLIIAMWIYIPARNWIWDKLIGRKFSFRHQSRTLEKMLDIFESTDQDPHTSLRSWMIHYFNPAEVEHLQQRSTSTSLKDNGLQVLVPGLNDDSWLLKGKNRGLELFTFQDLKMIDLFWKINSHALNLINAREVSEIRERKRIMRDLHDDVGAKLLSLVHGCKDPKDADLARSTLHLLRQTVISLKEKSSKNVIDAKMEWKSEINSRLEIADITFRWEDNSAYLDQDLSAREYINLSKILREVINNILRHANPSEVSLKLTITEKGMKLMIENDGSFTDPESWKAGTGLENIRTRAEEIGAVTKWQIFNYDTIKRLQFLCTLEFGVNE